MSQYTFSLALPPVFNADNFFVSACNREAWQWIESWPNWNALILHGASGSGKSHLGHIWAARAGATMLNAKTLPTEPARGNFLIEDIETLTSERTLFHWLNYVREQGGSLLLTASVPAQNLPFTLPDLTSRLLALPVAFLDLPDDDVLAGAIRKQFADRQMKVDNDVIAYITARMERSLAQAGELVDRLDKAALAEGKGITIPFVKRVLESLEN